MAIASCVDLGGIEDCCWEDQQSTLTFTWKGDRLMCWSGGLMIAVWRDWQWTLTFTWKGDCVKCWSLVGGGWQLLLKGSTVNFNIHVKRQSHQVLILRGEGIDDHCWRDQQWTLTFMWKGDHLKCWSGGGINNCCWRNRQSTFTATWNWMIVYVHTTFDDIHFAFTIWMTQLIYPV